MSVTAVANADVDSSLNADVVINSLCISQRLKVICVHVSGSFETARLGGGRIRCPSFRQLARSNIDRVICVRRKSRECYVHTTRAFTRRGLDRGGDLAAVVETLLFHGRVFIRGVAFDHAYTTCIIRGAVGKCRWSLLQRYSAVCLLVDGPPLVMGDASWLVLASRPPSHASGDLGARESVAIDAVCETRCIVARQSSVAAVLSRILAARRAARAGSSLGVWQ